MSSASPARSPRRLGSTTALRRTGLALLTFAALTAPLAAQTFPLGTAEDFAIFGSTAISNTGSSVIDGDVGISPNDASSVTGFPPGIINGTTHFGDGVAAQARDDARTAFNTLAGLACDETISADLGGRVLTPGVYCSGTSMSLTGTLTLDAQSDPDAQFVFQIGTTLTTAGASTVNVINGGQDCNVFWQVGSSATLGTTSTLAGSIIADQSITSTTSASASGRMLAINGAVTLDTSAISLCQLASGPPAISKSFNPNTIAIDGTSVLTVTLANANPTIATLTSALIDNLPGGVVVANLPNLATSCGGIGAPIALAGGSTVTLPAGRTIPANGSCTLSVAVTSALVGVYPNTIPIGALQTSNGNNLAPANATLTVLGAIATAPSLSKAFNPTTINANGRSTLTVTLTNGDPTVATLTTNLVDNLPSGVRIANPTNVATSCGGTGAPTATAGGTTLTLPAGRSIPANGSCTVSVAVTASLAGVYVNTLPAGALVTSNGVNPAPASATLTVATALATPQIIPLSPWSLLLIGGLVVLLATVAMGRQGR